MDRRTTIKWMLAASASMPLISQRVPAEVVTSKVPVPKGYGTDPVLTRAYHRGELWPLAMTDAQRRTAAALCDVILEIPMFGQKESFNVVQAAAMALYHCRFQA